MPIKLTRINKHSSYHRVIAGINLSLRQLRLTPPSSEGGKASAPSDEGVVVATTEGEILQSLIFQNHAEQT